MRRRSRTGSASVKSRRRKAATLKRRTAPKVRHRSSEAGQETEVARLSRELSEAREQQVATADVLKVISRSTFDLNAVLQTLIESAGKLCDADQGVITRRREGVFYRAEAYGYSKEFMNHVRGVPVEPGRGTVLGRALSERKVVQIPDVQADPEWTFIEAQRLGNFRTVLGVPMLREGMPIGVFALTRSEVRPFTDKQIELVTRFADQAVIAIENTRLLNELRQRTDDLSEALEQQIATSEVLKVISSSPGELEPVFNDLLKKATRLCEAKFGNLFLREENGFRHVSMHGAPSAYMALGKPLVVLSEHPHSPLAEAVQTKQTVHVSDMSAHQSYLEQDGRIVALVDAAGARTILTVPMLKDNDPVGAIVIYRQEVRLFNDKQIELVQNFAAQAVIAIENARLLNELRQRTTDLGEALEQQTATSQVLRVISASPGKLIPVFQAMLENAVRICNAKFGNLLRYDGSAYTMAAMHGAPPEWEKYRRRDPTFRAGPKQPLGRLATTKQFQHVADAETETSYVERDPVFTPIVDIAGARTILYVPMLKEDTLVGALVIYRQEVRPFNDKQIALLTNFAAQAVIAIENAELLDELHQRTDDLSRSVSELQALGEVSQSVNSTLDLKTVLSTIVSKAVQLSGTEAGTIYEFDEIRQEFKLRTTYGMNEELIGALENEHIGLDEPSIAAAVVQREPTQVADLGNQVPTAVNEIILRAGYRALLLAPLLRGRDTIGLLVIRRRAPGEFPKSTRALLQTFADQSVVAIQNARLFGEIEEKSKELAEASQHKSQFLANMSHELRTPLNAILGYTELMADGAYGQPSEKMLGILKRLEANGRHLLGLINDVLDLSKIEAGQLELELSDYSVQDIAQTVRSTLEPLAADKKLAFKVEVPTELPPGRGDGRRLTQVLINLVGNAIKFTDAGEVAIKAEANNGSYHVSVRDTGPGISAADQAKLFQEFQQADNAITRKKGGTGLGLAISKRIIEMHGGRMWVESQPGQGSTFRFTLPIIIEAQVPEDRPARMTRV